jgi:hypothetical protein
MNSRRQQFTYQLSIWVNDAKELDFMRAQLAKGNIPSRIRRRKKNGKVALFRPPVDRSVEISRGDAW